jgi:predicted nucleic acid-binding protein
MNPVNYLLDTVAISEAVKSSKDAGYMTWLTNTNDEHLYVSCLALGEIQKGISLADDPKLRQKLEDYLAGLYEAFANRILEFNVYDATIWGKLTAKAQKSVKTPPVIDSLLAAQSIRNHMVLVTRNIKDFEQFTELNILNPWSE